MADSRPGGEKDAYSQQRRLSGSARQPPCSHPTQETPQKESHRLPARQRQAPCRASSDRREGLGSAPTPAILSHGSSLGLPRQPLIEKLDGEQIDESRAERDLGYDIRSGRWGAVLASCGDIASYLSSYKYPSTTSRIPRTILHHSNFKGNEFRLILSFGLPAFRLPMKIKYYHYFQLLVIAMQLAESRSIEPSTIPDIDDLLTKFLQQFPLLHTKRHNVQSVHSIEHIGATVQDFGQLSNYSTFNFESLLGISSSFETLFRKYPSKQTKCDQKCNEG
ncbi:unnamed protein product [Didymodactylos carnosus]|uniref:Uncharacterized protein n=1 Tax=Didymodactylos carnosus TaxID=1234261 RepID=A0A814ZGA2_9BILA|nr:unnamed protein product [Didymodactylos carnosus]CAF4005419.1 unnamed protein product [Didymodactylos carnosus]